MKNFKVFFSLFCALVVLVSCSKDEETVVDGPSGFNALTIVTKQAVFVADNLSFISGGKASMDVSDTNEYQVGICYSSTINPTVFNNIDYSYQINEENFNNVIPNFIVGQTYYIKAFVRKISTNEVKYGNQVSFQIPVSLTTNWAKNISVTGFQVDANVGSIFSSNTERGVCYGTNHDPTIADRIIVDSNTGSGNFTISVEGNDMFPFYYVNSNTIYYLRSYVKLNGVYYYGNETSFRTAGYINGSGGYVFFDMGTVLGVGSNAWRYLEAAPAKLTAANNNHFSWSNSACGYSFYPAIINGIGDGRYNSHLISYSCNYPNVAATACQTTLLNGKNDWFLPSIDELKEMYKLKYTGQLDFGSDVLLSSSHFSSSLCFAIDGNNGSTVTVDKVSLQVAWQVRMFL